MHGLRKLLVIAVTLGLCGSVVAPAHADTIITYQILPDLQGLTVDIQVSPSPGSQAFPPPNTYTTSNGDLNFSIAGQGLLGFSFSDVFMSERDISPPVTTGLLFVLSDGTQLPWTAYVYVHAVTGPGCEQCTVIDFLAGVISVSQYPHDPAIQTFFTNYTGGLQDIGSYVTLFGNEITFMVQSPTNVVPLPAALPLLAGGLGGLGLMGWWRRRKEAKGIT